MEDRILANQSSEDLASPAHSSSDVTSNEKTAITTQDSADKPCGCGKEGCSCSSEGSKMLRGRLYTQ